jgi:hypothetical protein
MLTKESTPTDVMAAWADRLESGQDQQCQGQLRRDNKEGPAYCCLGVLSEMAVEAGVIDPVVIRAWESDGDCTCEACESDRKLFEYYYDGADSFPSVKVADWAFGEGTVVNNPVLIADDGTRVCASDLNDQHGYTFPMIGAAVRRTYGV